MDIWQYMLRREREFARFGVHPDRPTHAMYQAAEDSPNGKRGRVRGSLLFPDDRIRLDLFERVVVRGVVVHRERYAYTLVIDEAHEYGWERDKTHDPAVHEHEGSGRIVKATKPISLAAVLNLCWDRFSELPASDPD